MSEPEVAITISEAGRSAFERKRKKLKFESEKGV